MIDTTGALADRIRDIASDKNVLAEFKADLAGLDARAAEFTNPSERIRYVCSEMNRIMRKYQPRSNPNDQA